MIFPTPGSLPGPEGGARWPARPASHIRRRLVLAGAASLLFWALLQWWSPPDRIPWSGPMRAAAAEMARGIELVARHCREAGIPVDPALDPAGTCLIGPRYTPLFTTLGQLEAKRTTLNPDVAGLLVHLLERAGVSAGDSVAVGASGSFPGLLLATLSALEALGAYPVAILSLGASSYGATRPELHLLDLFELFLRAGLVTEPPAAVSFGGEEDQGLDLGAEEREALRRAVADAGIPLLDETGLRANVMRRMDIYGSPKAFVNIGGAEANLGTSPAILDLPPGLLPSGDSVSELELPPPEERGVLFEMAARGVPVIHLLHLRGLALRHGLPWDPVPLPEPGSSPLRDGVAERGAFFWLLTVAYLGILAVLGLVRRPPRLPGKDL